MFIGHPNDAEYYYNKWIARNSYTRVDIVLEETVSIQKVYSKDKSFPLRRTVINISYPSDCPEIPFVAVV